MELTVENVIAVLPQDPEGMGFVYMELYENYIMPEDFVSRFSGATLTFESLYNHPNATTGWKNQFTAWKEAGILN